jgi:hypothetical protein
MLVLALHDIAAQRGEGLRPELLRLLRKDSQATGERGGEDCHRRNVLHRGGHVASCHLDNVVRLPGLVEELGARAVETERHEEVTGLNGPDPV